MTFGEKIRRLREEQEISQGVLGESLQMTQRKVSYIENDKYEPSIEDIRIICQYFHVSANYLLDLPDDLPYPR